MTEKQKKIQLIDLHFDKYLGLSSDKDFVAEIGEFDVKNLEGYNIFGKGRFWQIIHILTYFLKGDIKYFKFLQKFIAKKHLKNIDLNSDCLVFGPWFFSHCRLVYNDYFFDILNRVYRGNVYIYFVDTIDTINAGLKPDYARAILSRIESGSFDEVYTISMGDVNKFNFKFAPHPADQRGVDLANILYKSGFAEEKKYQISGVGSVALHRSKEIKVEAFVRWIVDKELRYGLLYTGSENEFINKHNNLPDLRNAKPQIPGGNFVNSVLNTNCILHISDGNYISWAHGQAVLLNKKILTDSNCVLDQPWYNPDFVRVFDPLNPTEADLEWIKKEVDVHYTNSDSLSLENILITLTEDSGA